VSVAHLPSASEIVRGPACLPLATRLLQRMRVARPDGGIWEAADVQWWSRQERPTDTDGQLFWLDERGEPLAAVLRTAFGSTVQCDVLVLPDSPGAGQAAWQAAIDRAGELGAPAEFPVRADDAAGLAALTAAGYVPSGDPGVVSCWLDAAGRPPVPELAPGYRLLSRAQAPDGPHPISIRNGAQAESRLRHSSLYRPDLDLKVCAPDGTVAGYGLFWADPVTRVGLVEPMRTEQEHQRRGIASYLLAAGLDRLAAAGCERLKVSNDLGLYLRAGFQQLAAATAALYVEPAPAG
jgi:GNAT superfamily N-acetyltransferase